MKALILNSGIGSRMGAFTQEKPKGLLDIGGGYTLLHRQLELLAKANVCQAVITTGPFAGLLEAHARSLALPMELSFVSNADYAATNYIWSMHLAAPLLEGQDVLLLHGDLVLEESVLQDLLACPFSAMAVDSTLPLPQKDFKAQLREGRIVAVGVDLMSSDCVACQPAYRWLAKDFSRWLQSIASFVNKGQRGVYSENAFNALDGALPLFPLELQGRLCHEIDDPHDLSVVSERFLRTLPPIHS